MRSPTIRPPSFAWLAAIACLAGCQSVLGYGDITFDRDSGSGTGGSEAGQGK